MPITHALGRLTIAIGLSAMVGCGGEERGPLLAGGREVKSWVADLHHPKPQARRRAVLKLGNVGDADPAVGEALAEALHDLDPLVRRDAIVAVLKLKQPREAIRDQLDVMSKTDKDARAREMARKAMERLGKME
jgi:HEAT repeat protein